MVERVTRAGNATIGLAAVCAAWFKEVGLQGEGKGLAGTLQRDREPAGRGGFRNETVVSGVTGRQRDSH